MELNTTTEDLLIIAKYQERFDGQALEMRAALAEIVHLARSYGVFYFMFLRKSPAFESLKNEIARWNVSQVAAEAIEELGFLKQSEIESIDAEA